MYRDFSQFNAPPLPRSKFARYLNRRLIERNALTIFEIRIGEKGTVLGKSRIHRILPSYPLSLLDGGGERKGKKGVAVVESRQVLHE